MTQIEFLRQCVDGEVSIDLAEYGERVLADVNDHVARAVLRIVACSDKRALWERFISSLVRVYGDQWSHWDALTVTRPLVCHIDGCMELALNGICDQCLGAGLS